MTEPPWPLSVPPTPEDAALRQPLRLPCHLEEQPQATGVLSTRALYRGPLIIAAQMELIADGRRVFVRQTRQSRISQLKRLSLMFEEGPAPGRMQVKINRKPLEIGPENEEYTRLSATPDGRLQFKEVRKHPKDGALIQITCAQLSPEGAHELAQALRALADQAQAQEDRYAQIYDLLAELRGTLSSEFEGPAVPNAPWPGVRAAQLGGITVWHNGARWVAYHPACGWYEFKQNHWGHRLPGHSHPNGSLSRAEAAQLLRATRPIQSQLRMISAGLRLGGLRVPPELGAPPD